MRCSGDARGTALPPAAVVSSPSSSAAIRAFRLGLAAAVAGALWAAGPVLAGSPAETTPETTPVVETTAPPADPSLPPAPPATEPATPPAQVPLVAASPDMLAPAVAISAVRHRLEYARRNGLRVAFSLSEPALLKADVLLYGEVNDRELRMSALPAAGPGDSLAKATVSAPPSAKGVVRLTFNLAARRTLRKFLKLTVLLRVIATDAAGNTATAYKRVTLSNL